MAEMVYSNAGQVSANILANRNAQRQYADNMQLQYDKLAAKNNRGSSGGDDVLGMMERLQVLEAQRKQDAEKFEAMQKQNQHEFFRNMAAHQQKIRSFYDKDGNVTDLKGLQRAYSNYINYSRQMKNKLPQETAQLVQQGIDVFDSLHEGGALGDPTNSVDSNFFKSFMLQAQGNFSIPVKMLKGGEDFAEAQRQASYKPALRASAEENANRLTKIKKNAKKLRPPRNYELSKDFEQRQANLVNAGDSTGQFEGNNAPEQNTATATRSKPDVDTKIDRVFTAPEQNPNGPVSVMRREDLYPEEYENSNAQQEQAIPEQQEQATPTLTATHLMQAINGDIPSVIQDLGLQGEAAEKLVKELMTAVDMWYSGRNYKGGFADFATFFNLATAGFKDQMDNDYDQVVNSIGLDTAKHLETQNQIQHNSENALNTQLSLKSKIATDVNQAYENGKINANSANKTIGDTNQAFDDKKNAFDPNSDTDRGHSLPTPTVNQTVINTGNNSKESANKQQILDNAINKVSGGKYTSTQEFFNDENTTDQDIENFLNSTMKDPDNPNNTISIRNYANKGNAKFAKEFDELDGLTGLDTGLNDLTLGNIEGLKMTDRALQYAGNLLKTRELSGKKINIDSARVAKLNAIILSQLKKGGQYISSNYLDLVKYAMVNKMDVGTAQAVVDSLINQNIQQLQAKSSTFDSNSSAGFYAQLTIKKARSNQVARSALSNVKSIPGFNNKGEFTQAADGTPKYTQDNKTYVYIKDADGQYTWIAGANK